MQGIRHNQTLKQKFMAKQVDAESLCYSFHTLNCLHIDPSCAVARVTAVPASRHLNVQIPDKHLPLNKIVFFQILSKSVPITGSRVPLYICEFAPHCEDFPDFLRYPNLHELRLIPTREIAFVE